MVYLSQVSVFRHHLPLLRDANAIQDNDLLEVENDEISISILFRHRTSPKVDVAQREFHQRPVLRKLADLTEVVDGVSFQRK